MITRKEAKSITIAISFKYDGKQRITVDGVHELIDQIYNDLESYLTNRMDDHQQDFRDKCIFQEVLDHINGTNPPSKDSQ